MFGISVVIIRPDLMNHVIKDKFRLSMSSSTDMCFLVDVQNGWQQNNKKDNNKDKKEEIHG